MEKKAYYHLPGLFEFYELYSVFLPLFDGHREYFYENAEIASIYGAPGDCLWGGGRVGFGDADPQKVLALMEEHRISARLTLSNSLLREEHLGDRKCNRLCETFEKGGNNGAIVASELLTGYLKSKFPGLYLVSSTTKVITVPGEFVKEAERPEFDYIVPDFRLNRRFDILSGLSPEIKSKVEFLCNECCDFDCKARKQCYENVSRKSLGEDVAEHKCVSRTGAEGYRFSEAMKNPGFIGSEDIRDIYLPMGFSNFKLEGRGLGSAVVFEMLLYYLTKPEYRLKVREEVYLDVMLDLF